MCDIVIKLEESVVMQLCPSLSGQKGGFNHHSQICKKFHPAVNLFALQQTSFFFFLFYGTSGDDTTSNKR